jgi:type VI secretion system protein ImpG
VPIPGPITFGRGLEIIVTLDESAFEGLGVFLLGAVLDEFFAKYVSINSFTETVIKTTERGEIMRWPVRIGLRHIL